MRYVSAYDFFYFVFLIDASLYFNASSENTAKIFFQLRISQPLLYNLHEGFNRRRDLIERLRVTVHF
jgi:hypothetical protein